LRLRDRADQTAWNEFAEIYRPVIFSLAKMKGFQDADAEDIAQLVLASVLGATFRTWLHRVTHHALINAVSRRKPDRAAGDSVVQGYLNQLIAEPKADSELIQLEYRREMFRWAAKQIEGEFHAGTWQAFWRTTVEGEPIDRVATSLGKGIGSIYAARSRVMARLREKISELSLDDFESLHNGAT
jgi:RNA polymerase sigma-70 factor (ECF subfamily)